MDERSLAELTHRKIFPRNLTARADYVVRGNPTNSRPESGVGNSFPGLEFDLRNLDKDFFPGLRFDFHRDDGAILRSLDPASKAAKIGLTAADLRPKAPGARYLYLWAVLGRTVRVRSRDDIPVQSFDNLGGLDVWRRVHDLAPGKIAILIGAARGQGARIPNGALRALRDQLDAGTGRLKREKGGALAWAVLVEDRAPYLDATGVIDPDVYQPGDLTRSLCVPWQYDFRDCGCFYWASNKPDLVASADGSQPYLNFQRKDRSTNTPDIPPAPPVQRDQWDALRGAAEMDYADLIQGGWNDLAVVLNDRESTIFNPAPVMHRPPMSLAEVKDRFKYLATVEHAVSVEYLYAHYSVNAPYAIDEAALEDLPESYSFDQRAPRVPAMNPDQERIFTAAMEIFRIAVDEMRHLHWANEALFILGEEPSILRAPTIGTITGLDQPFALLPLTADQLDWFIKVEQPSQAKAEGTIDGMYVWLLDTIESAPQGFPQADRLIEIIKLIIDEGGGHYERFLRVQAQLDGIPEKTYLIVPRTEPLDAGLNASLDLSDQYYSNLLGALQLSFSAGERSDGELLNQSRRLMYSLHEINHRLAAQGVMPRFTIPDPFPHVPARTGTRIQVRARKLTFAKGLESSMDAGLNRFEARAPADRDMATRFRRVNATVFDATRQLL